MLCMCYIIAFKFHLHDNGPQAHMLSFWATGLGIIGMGLRLFVRSGKLWFNSACMATLWFSVWYDLGRFHLWTAWWGEFNKAHSATKKTGKSIWTEYIPTDIRPDLLMFRRLHVEEEVHQEVPQ